MSDDLAAVLDDVDRRLTLVEQIATSPVEVDNTFPEIIIDDGENPPIPINTAPPGDVSNLIATPGTFFDDIFADIDWDAPVAGEPPAWYDVELGDADNAYSLITVVQTSGTNYRFTGLEPVKNYGVRVTPVSIIGVRGNSTAWVDFETERDATLPAAPQNLIVFRAPDSLIATWDPNTEGDVAWGHGIYEVELSDDDFATIGWTIRTGATVVAFEGILEEDTYKVRVRAIDSSGNAGPDTTSGNVLAGSIIGTMIQAQAITETKIADDAITTPKIAANAVTANEIAALTITAAQIAASTITGTKIAAATITAAKMVAGTLTANEIASNSITADRLTTSTLTAATITISGGSLKVGNPPTDGLLINSQGLRLYNASAATVILDSGGTATYSGAINASVINTSEFYWPGGTIRDADGIRIYVAPWFSNGQYAISLVDATSPWAMRWTMWAPNISQLWIQRVTDNGLGTLILKSNRVIASSFGTPGADMGDFYWFSGSSRGLNVTGDMQCISGTKYFVIDHPLRPDEEFLRHAAIEGPEKGVYYRGRAKLKNGAATVELPDYFEALVMDEDRGVQVTPLSGEGSCTLSVSEIVNGLFTVTNESDKHSTREFFWTVFAVRGDVPPIEVVVNKVELEGAVAHLHAELEVQAREQNKKNAKDLTAATVRSNHLIT